MSRGEDSIPAELKISPETERFLRAPKIAVAGPLYAGKSTAAQYLQEQYGLGHYSSSEVLKNYAIHERGIIPPFTRDSLMSIGFELQDRFGRDFLVKLNYLAMIRDMKDGMVQGAVFDAVRNNEERALMKSIPRGRLVWIDAPLEERALRRKREDLALSQSFVEENTQNAAIFEDFSADADFTVVNSGSIDDFYAQLDNVMNQAYPDLIS